MKIQHWIALAIMTILFLRYFYFLLECWEYKQFRKRFYDGKPKAWYPPIKKPQFFIFKYFKK